MHAPAENQPSAEAPAAKTEEGATQIEINREAGELEGNVKPVLQERAAEQDGRAEEPATTRKSEKDEETEEPKEKAKADDKNLDSGEAKKIETSPPPEPVKPACFGFEGIGAWQAASWADGIELSETTDPRKEGAKALRLRVKRPKQGKSAIGLEAPLRLVDYGIVSLDVCLESDKNYPALLTIGFVVGDQNLWVESAPRLLQKGWNEGLRFNLYQAEWKTEATKWRYRTSAQGKGNARSIYLLFHGLDYDESLVVDNLIFLPAGTGATVPPEAKLAEAKCIVATAARKRENDDLSRADSIRAYALSSLADYATDLAARGQIAEANRLAEIIGASEKAPLVARPMPVTVQQEPAVITKSAEAKTGEEKTIEQASQPTNALIISIPKRGAVNMAGEDMRRGAISRRLKELFRQKGDRLVIIRAEADVPLAKISEVEEACKEAGFTAINIEQQ